jgi:hypothetical protein
MELLNSGIGRKTPRAPERGGDMGPSFFPFSSCDARLAAIFHTAPHIRAPGGVWDVFRDISKGSNSSNAFSFFYVSVIISLGVSRDLLSLFFSFFKNVFSYPVFRIG